MKISMRELGKYCLLPLAAIAMSAFSGCNAPNGGATSLSNAQLGAPGCSSNDPNHVCIGLKVVSYTSGGVAALKPDQAVKLVNDVNAIWNKCNIAFQVDEYDAVDPNKYGLSYGASSENELSQIRAKFSDDKTFLLALTGSWNTATIAWTQMPGSGPYGAVVDADYAPNGIAVGHELGHYMGLDHVQTSGNLMYPIVYDNDTDIDASQCADARSMDQSNWKAMLR